MLSRKVAERLAGEANIAVPIGDDDDDVDDRRGRRRTRRSASTSRSSGLDARVLAYDELLAEPDVSVGAVAPRRSRATRSRR